jgi:hypothetical protein
MEKEADFVINPEVDVTLTLNILKNKCQDNYRYLLDHYKYICKNRDLETGYDYIINLMHLDVEPANFIQYLKERVNERIKCGFEDYKKLITSDEELTHEKLIKYILRQLAAHRTITETKIHDIPCTCTNSDPMPKNAMMQVLPVAQNDDPCIIYNSCLRTLFAAFKRQLKATPRPEKDVMDKFEKFSKDFIDQYITPHIPSFDYSYTEWYAHLTHAKQIKMDKAREMYESLGCPTIVEFGLFCKREVQQDGGKNRAIANISDIVKYIMGPVCWALEAMFTKLFPGYCGNKSGEDLEDWLAETYAAGFVTSLQGDGSGFDLSQHQECKFIDNYIYNLISEKVHHVNKDHFLYIANMSVRQLNASIFINKSRRTPFSARIRGTVFSGSSDTTLMNTIRMALYNHFTLHEAGLTLYDYKLLAKGDDFMFFINNNHHLAKIKQSYARLWSPKPKDPKALDQNYNRKGLGQIIKFLKIGDFTELDFCSNAVIPYKQNNQTLFRVLRRPERMIELTHYSRKALQYEPGQMKAYFTMLKVMMEKTSGDIPFYRNYLNAFAYWESQIKAPPVTIKLGPPRKQCPIDDTKQHSNTYKHPSLYLDFVKKFAVYGTDFLYSVYNRMSSHTIPEEYVYSFLLEKYGLTKTIIDMHANILLNFNCIYNPVSEFILRE